jgi:hypothetical protein
MKGSLKKMNISEEADLNLKGYGCPPLLVIGKNLSKIGEKGLEGKHIKMKKTIGEEVQYYARWV